MRKTIAIVAGVLLLAVVNWGIYSRERLLASGRVVLLELAPVDPRSLMQGDYMALRFKATNDAFGRARGRSEESADGRLVVAVDERGVGSYARLDDGGALADNEARIRYRIRNGQPKLATNAYFFAEGRGSAYAKARYGEFRVAPDGEVILTRLRDDALLPLGGDSVGR
jgi:uncharacterized membrane-anchored protein